MQIQKMHLLSTQNNKNKPQSFKSLQITPKGMAILSDMFIRNPETEVKFSKYIAGPLKNLKTQVMFDGYVADIKFTNKQGKYCFVNPCPPFVNPKSTKCGYREEGFNKEINLIPEIMPKITKDTETYQDFLRLSHLEQARCIAEHFELKSGNKLNRSKIQPLQSDAFDKNMKNLYSQYGDNFKQLRQEKIDELYNWIYEADTKSSRAHSGPSYPTTHEDMLWVFLNGI